MHGDLNLDNVLITESRTIVLNFGVSSYLLRTSPIADRLIKETTSPDHLTEGGIDQRSDLYSFGAIFYSILTGLAIFEVSETEELKKCILTRAPPSVREVSPSIPVQISDLIDKLLRKLPEDRVSQAEDVVALLSRKIKYIELGAPVKAPGTFKFKSKSKSIVIKWSLPKDVVGSPRPLPKPPMELPSRSSRVVGLPTCGIILVALLLLIIGTLFMLDVRQPTTAEFQKYSAMKHNQGVLVSWHLPANFSTTIYELQTQDPSGATATVATLYQGEEGGVYKVVSRPAESVLFEPPGKDGNTYTLIDASTKARNGLRHVYRLTSSKGSGKKITTPWFSVSTATNTILRPGGPR